jgi:kynurenine formamidase
MRYVDLTHDIHEQIPGWPGQHPFAREVLEKEPANIQSYSMGGGCGTHMDAPSHFPGGEMGIADLPLERLIGPGCVIAISDEPNSELLPSHIEAFEKAYGKIPEGAIVLVHSGWCKRWNDIEAYQNLDADGFPQCPHVSLEAAELLLERKVSGLGIDSLGPDNRPPYPVHQLLLPAGKFFVENLTGLDQLPPIGAAIFALPLKVRGGSEAGTRCIALVPESETP